MFHDAPSGRTGWLLVLRECRLRTSTGTVGLSHFSDLVAAAINLRSLGWIRLQGALAALETADRQEGELAQAKYVRLHEKIAALREQMAAFKALEPVVHAAPGQQASLQHSLMRLTS